MRAPILPVGRASIREAAHAVRAGGLVVFPTDTVYGLGCDPFDEAALGRIFQAKGRESKPLPVLCSSLADASRLVSLGAEGEKLARAHWPGGLTLVSELKVAVPRMLDQGTGTLGVRVPALKEALELIEACGGALVGTSANLSGRPSSRTAAEAQDQLGGSVDVILDGGRLVGSESTVVRVAGRGVIVLRKGMVRVNAGETK